MRHEFKVIGMRIEKYLRQTCEGHNCDFTYGKEIADKHIILCKTGWGTKYEISLEEWEDQCGSGWCTSTEASMDITKVKSFKGITHRIKDEIYIEVDEEYECEDFIENEVFRFSEAGGDCYYPNGYYIVNMDKFEPIKNSRMKDKIPVWIFTGDSEAGKSYIASSLNGLKVFETDEYNSLPKEIEANVIVLGNKHGYTVKDIEDRIEYDHETIVVNFKKK